MFKNRTTLFFLIGSFLQALAFLPSNYLLPQMFQGVRGAGALDSGVQLLPYAVVVALSTVVGESWTQARPRHRSRYMLISLGRS
jgi:hypothetical protein